MKNPPFDPKTLRVVERDLRHEILTGEDRKTVVSVFDEDAELEGLGREIVIVTFKERIAAVIETYRHERKPEVIRQHAVEALWRTLVLALTLFLVIWGFRRLNIVL